MRWLANLARWVRGTSPRPTSPQAIPDSVEDWQVGDLAECIQGGDDWLSVVSGQHRAGPQTGQVCRVALVLIDPARRGDPAIQWLGLTGFPDKIVWNASAFRKVTPRADAAERGDAEFIALLNRLHCPARPALPASDQPAPARELEEAN